MSPDCLIDRFATFRRRLPDRARIYVAGCAGEPLALVRAIEAAPDIADGVTFIGVWVPGVNRTDWASLHPGARAETIFLGPALRQSFEKGRTRFRPLSYTQAARWLATGPVDAAVVMASALTEGEASFGIAADFSPILAARQEVPLFGLLNPAMPAALDGLSVRAERFAETAAVEHPLLCVPPTELSSTFADLGRNVAALVDDGATLQFGLGTVQQAVLSALGDKRRLRIHSGMVSDPVLDLIGSGAIADEPGAVTSGVAIGTEKLYASAAQHPSFRFRSVPFTHSLETLAATPRFTSINSAIEVDLFGQVNAEFLAGRQVSGTGGLVDFTRAAQGSPGGRAVIALGSTARGGSVSRIVPKLSAPAVSLPRSEAITVVTEHGAADLSLLSTEERAEALIRIADPAHRDALTRAWAGITGAL